MPHVVKPSEIRRGTPLFVRFLGTEGDRPVMMPAGRVKSFTPSRQTIITDIGLVFKHRWGKENSYALKDNPGTLMIVGPDASTQ